jgi:hypothetical protein
LWTSFILNKSSERNHLPVHPVLKRDGAWSVLLRVKCEPQSLAYLTNVAKFQVMFVQVQTNPSRRSVRGAAATPSTHTEDEAADGNQGAHVSELKDKLKSAELVRKNSQ